MNSTHPMISNQVRVRKTIRDAGALPARVPLAIPLSLLLLWMVGGCRKEEAPEPPPVRPLKTLVIGSEGPRPTRSFPGKVLAGQRVDLSFQVSGVLQELKIKAGNAVQQGDVLAQLDPRDFQNALAAAQAELERSRAQYERVKLAADLNAVSQQDLSNARAAFDVAQAQSEIKKKELEDSVLHAPFSGVIAARYVENFQSVQIKQPIVSLQNVAEVEIEVFLPESFLINRPLTSLEEAQARPKPREEAVAIFDALSGLTFPVTLKEFAVEADPITQAYRIVVAMPSPTNCTILPGMTATVRVTRLADPKEEPSAGFSVPLDAVPVDGATGKYFVWMVRPGSGNTATVEKQFVQVAETAGNNILVTSGLSSGDRIALAGVTVLQEGQVVKLADVPAQQGESK